MKYIVSANPRVTALPKLSRFTLSELQEAFEKIVGGRLDRRNFRKFLRVFRVVRQVKGTRNTGRRPARLYSYAPGRKRLVVL